MKIFSKQKPDWLDNTVSSKIVIKRKKFIFLYYGIFISKPVDLKTDCNCIAISRNVIESKLERSYINLLVSWSANCISVIFWIGDKLFGDHTPYPLIYTPIYQNNNREFRNLNALLTTLNTKNWIAFLTYFLDTWASAIKAKKVISFLFIVCILQRTFVCIMNGNVQKMEPFKTGYRNGKAFFLENNQLMHLIEKFQLGGLLRKIKDDSQKLSLRRTWIGWKTGIRVEKEQEVREKFLAVTSQTL